jgi:hypothetical protein
MRIIVECMEDRDKGDSPFCFADKNSIENWTLITDIEEWPKTTNGGDQIV